MKQSSDYNQISILDYTNQLIENIKQANNQTNVSYEVNIDEGIFVDMENAIPFGLI